MKILIVFLSFAKKVRKKNSKKFKKFIFYQTARAKIDGAPSTTVVSRWLSGAGTSQEVWSLI